MYFKKFFIIILVLIQMVTLSSCWSNIEINDLLLVNVLGIDKLEDDYILTLQVINPGRLVYKAGNTPSTITTYTQSGKTLLSAFKKLSSKVPKKIYTSHLQVILLGEDFASEGVSSILDLFLREVQFRANFNIALAKNISAESLIKKVSKHISHSSTTISDTLALSEKIWSPIYNSNLYDFVNCINSKGSSLLLPGVEIISGDDNSFGYLKSTPTLNINTLGIFQYDKFISWLTEKESLAVSIMSNKANNSFLDVNYENRVYSIDFYKIKNHISYELKDGFPLFTITLDCFGSLNSSSGNVPLDTNKLFSILEDKCNRAFYDYSISAINKAQLDLRCDILGLGEIIHRQDTSYWHKVKGNWDDIFSASTINLVINTNIDRSDKTYQPIERE